MDAGIGPVSPFHRRIDAMKGNDQGAQPRHTPTEHGISGGGGANSERGILTNHYVILSKNFPFKDNSNYQ